MLLAILVMCVAIVLLATALTLSRDRHSLRGGPANEASASRHREQALVEQINRLLPQTQCQRCTFPGCKPYATAIAHGTADFNQCPPGGDHTALRLAQLLGRPAKPVDRQFGPVHNPERDAGRSPLPTPALVAWIDEPACIGCAKCIQACPVDAIVGAPKFMHTVITSDCTGCELCVAPCPVDCIVMRSPEQVHLPLVERAVRVS